MPSKIVVATGSRPVRPAAIEFDEESILDSDGILNLAQDPAVARRRRAPA